MAKSYSSAIERARKLQKEEADTKTAPSSLLSEFPEKELEDGENKNYSEAIKRMRLVQSEMKEADTRSRKQNKAASSYYENMRTEEEILQSIEDTKKQISAAKTPSRLQSLVLLGNQALSGITGNQIAVNDAKTNRDKVTAESDKKVAFYEKQLAGYEAELAQRKQYDYQQKYGKLVENEDFEEKSRGYYDLRPTVRNADEKLKYLAMTETERGIYHYIKNTEGEKEAKEYFEFISDKLGERNTKIWEEYVAEESKKHPVAASVGSVITNATMGIPTFVAQGIDYIEDGKVDRNAIPYNFIRGSQTARNTVSQDVIGEKWGSAASTGYNIAMSIADSVVSRKLGGKFAQYVLSSSVASGTTLDALDRGISSGRAMLMGLAAGAIEAATEKWSIDSLLKPVTKPGMVGNLIYGLKQVGVEASEEAIAEVANTIADVIIAEDKSYWIQAINEYKMRGYTDSEAISRALMRKLGDVGLAALGGAISGGVMAGGRVAINAADTAVQNAAKVAVGNKTAYRGQEILRQSQNSTSNAEQNAQQQKYTVLPTAVEMERAKARERGDVFDTGYGRPYTGTAETADDIELQKRIDAAETITEKTGIRHGASEQDIADALAIGRAVGREVEFFTQKSADGKTVTDGFYSDENGHIYVNVNAAKALETVISHEFTHSVERTASYALLEKLARERLGNRFESEIKRLRKLYDDAGVDYSSDSENKFSREVVANFVERFVLGNKQSIMEITKKEPSFARKVKMWLNNLLAKLYRDPAVSEKVYNAVNIINDWYDEGMSRAAEEAATASVENATANEARENVENEEVITEEETPVTEAHESSQERGNDAEETPAETKKSPERESGVRSDTQTEIYDDAEEMMRRAEEAHAAGEITDEQLATVEGIYDEWYETGIRPDMSSEGFEEGKIPKALRKFFTGKRGVNWSVSEISPITDEDIKKVESHFGTTRNFEVAGYLMTDGKMLDFSGKHWGDDYSTSRTVDHRDVLEAFDYTGVHNGNNGIKAMVDMIGSGQIRLMPETGGINLAVAPNDAQIKTLAEYIRHFHGEMIVDVDEVGGDTTHTFTYNKGTAPMTVIRDIMQYFEDGTLPKAQPEYRQFLQWSISPTLEADLDAVLDHTFDAKNNEVYIGETSNFLTEVIGVDSMPVYMPASKAYAAMVPKEEWERTRYYKEQDHYHNLGKEKMIEILNASENPIAAFVATTDLDGNERNNRIVLVTDVKIDGQNAVVIEEIETTALKEGRRVKANKVITTYDRAMIADDIVNAYNENRLLHFDKKRSQNLAGVRGSKPQAAIRDTDFANNIAQFWWNVNKGKLNVTNLQYSISDANIPDDYKEFARSIPYRDSEHLRGIVNQLASKLHKILKLDTAKVQDGYRTKEYTDFIESVVYPMVMEYMKTSDISDATVKKMFEAYYAGTPELAQETYNKKKTNALTEFERAVLTSISNLSAVRDSFIEADEEMATESAFGEAERILGEAEDAAADKDMLDLGYLTPAVKRELRVVERSIANAAIKALGLDIETGLIEGEDGKKHRSEKYLRFIREAVRPITNEYLRTGQVSETIVNEIFEKKYDSEKVPNKKLSRAMFDRAIEYNSNALKIVRKVMLERKNKDERMTAFEGTYTKEKYDKLKKNLEYARRNEEEVKKAPGNLLTEHDEMIVGEVLMGQMKPESIMKQADNKKGAMAVYEAKKATQDAARADRQFKEDARAQYRKLVNELLGGVEGINRWHEKGNTTKSFEKLAKKGIFEEKIPGGWAYARETFTRNIYDIAPDKETAERVIRELYYPIQKNEAENNRFKDELIERVKKLDISQKVKKGDKFSESYAVQYYGEASYYISVLEKMSDPDAQIGGGTLRDWRAGVNELFATSPGLDRAKIENCAKEFRKIYDELYVAINDAYVRNGYRPLGRLEGYFPHFTKHQDNSFISLLLHSSGVNVTRVDLPTSINGLTDSFKPGRKYFSHAEHRTGYKTDYDAIEGLESYLETAGRVIFHTDDIQRLRAFANEIRYLTGSDQVRAAMDEIYDNDTLDAEQKQVQLDTIRTNGEYKLSKAVVWLDEYTNILAGKKSKYDRGAEDLAKRRIYLVMQAIKNRVGANMIAANVSSAMTNFIPLNQAGAILGPDYILRGMWQTLWDLKQNGDIWDTSTFLINRMGHESLTNNKLRKFSDVASMPMSFIDAFSAASIIRAAYARNIKYGLDETEAMYQADLFAASIMAGRSVGEMPTIFHAKNPLFQLFSQFQLEVNNEFSVILKDIPKAEKKRWLDSTAIRYFMYFIGAALFNDIFEALFGRRPALDPIGIFKEAGEDIANGTDADEVITKFGTNVVEQVPFIGSILGGGRLPVTNALPNLGNIIKAASDPDWSPKKKYITIATEMFDPIMYLVPPFGGGALRKIAQTTDAWIRGGKYTYDTSGDKKLQYPIYTETTGDVFKNLFVGELFGTTSLPSGREWVKNGFGSLGTMQTDTYEALVDADVSQRKAFNLINDLAEVKADAKETKTEVYEYAGMKIEIDVPVDSDADIMTKAEKQRQVLRDSDISGEGKSIAYFGLLANDSERMLMATLDNLDADMGAVTNVLMGMKDAGSTPEKIDLLIKANLDDDEKRLIYEDRISESRAEDVIAFAEAGMNFDTFLECNKKYNELYNGEGNASYKATALARWINQKGFDAKEKAVIEEAFKYYSMIPAKAGKYDDFTDAGLDDETAYKLTEALSDLTPPEGKSQVTALQKYRAVVDTVASPVYQMDALEKVMSESEFKKTSAAYSYGIEAETYITFREKLTEYDKDGNGSLTQLEVEDALNALSGNLTWAEKMTIELTGGSAPGILYLNNDQLAVLWQLANPSWNPKNNPYDSKIGAAIKELMEKE